MPNTTRGYPYPSNSDDVDVPGDLQALATAIDADVATVYTAATAAPEGTAIKSTGATSGYVLTAGASSTATTWAALPAGGGALTIPVRNTGTYGTVATADSTPVVYNFAGHGYGYKCAVHSNGTGITLVQNGTASTSSYSFNYVTFNLNNTTPVVNSSVDLGASGTTYVSVAGMNYTTNGTAVVVVWSGANSSTFTSKIAKLNSTGTIMWNTTVDSFTTNGSSIPSYFGNAKYVAGVRWAESANVWYFGGHRTMDNASGTSLVAAGTARISNVYIVNNTSGSVYSAAFSSASSSAVYNGVWGLVYVPDNVGTPTAGTIHAWGYANGSARYCVYTVGSASITAVSTATASGTGTYNAVHPWLYHSGMTNVMFSDGVIWTSNTFRVWDRTGGTLLHAAERDNNVEAYLYDYSAPEEQWDGYNRVLSGGAYYDFTRNNATLYKTGSIDGSFTPANRWLWGGGAGFDYTSYNGVVCGAGTPNYWFWYRSNGGTAGSIRYAYGTGGTSLYGLARISIDTAGSGNRYIIPQTVQNGAIAFEANGTSLVRYVRRYVNNQEFQMLDDMFTAGGSAFVYASIVGQGWQIGTAVVNYNEGGTALMWGARIQLG